MVNWSFQIHQKKIYNAKHGVLNATTILMLYIMFQGPIYTGFTQFLFIFIDPFTCQFKMTDSTICVCVQSTHAHQPTTTKKYERNDRKTNLNYTQRIIYLYYHSSFFRANVVCYFHIECFNEWWWWRRRRGGAFVRGGFFVCVYEFEKRWQSLMANRHLSGWIRAIFGCRI